MRTSVLSEVEIVRKTRHLFDTAFFMEQIQFVQFIKEFVEFLLKFDALIGVFEYALASGLGELLQTLTVHLQICRLADGLSGFCFEHGLQTGVRL